MKIPHKIKWKTFCLMFLCSVMPITAWATPVKLTSAPAIMQISNLKTAPTKLNFINDKLRIQDLEQVNHFNYVIAKLIPIDGNGVEVRTSAAQRTDKDVYDIQLVIPPMEDGEYALTLYSSSERYGTYRSFLTNNIGVTVKNGKAYFKLSAAYSHNYTLYNSYTLTEDLTTPETTDEQDLAVLTNLAYKITEGLTDDYSKALKVHDWIARNIYYDYDAYNTKQYGALTAIDVYNSKRTVCAGYADLYKELMRILGIPCKYVSGIALNEGVFSDWSDYADNKINHAWNEVYADGRWIVLDVTWDSPNKYVNGVKSTKGEVLHTYFDTTLKVFSMDHKIIEQ